MYLCGPVYAGSSTEEEVLKSGGSSDDVRLPEELGGGYMTSVEVVHQLHCLNLIRKMTHYDYYKDKAIEFRDPPHTVRLHVGMCDLSARSICGYLRLTPPKDHCIEITRQNIMCNADAGLMSHHWIEGYPRPYANFNTWHKCRNFEQVLDWAYKHQIPVPKGKWHFPMVPGSHVFPDAPQPDD